MDNAKTIRAIRNFYHDRKVVAVGDLLTLPEGKAREYVSTNKAEFVAETKQEISTSKVDVKESVSVKKEPDAAQKKGGTK